MLLCQRVKEAMDFFDLLLLLLLLLLFAVLCAI
jgi:hypothetical protein